MQISKQLVRRHASKIGEAFFNHSVTGVRYPLESHIWPISLIRNSPETADLILGTTSVVLYFDDLDSLVGQLNEHLLSLSTTALRNVIEFEGNLSRGALDEITYAEGTIVFCGRRCNIIVEPGIRRFDMVEKPVIKWWQFWIPKPIPVLTFYPICDKMLEGVTWY